MMRSTFLQLFQDESGFIVSAELVLVGSILLLGMIAGLGELSLNINSEMEDMGSAFSALSQTYTVTGLDGHVGGVVDQSFTDTADFCSAQADISCQLVP